MLLGEAMSTFLKAIIGLVCVVQLSGCGTYTPEFQEFWGTSDDNDDRINAIVHQVKCELRRAFRLIESVDIKNAKEEPSLGRVVKFLEDWAVDTAFLFTIEEKSSLTPGVSFNTPLATAITTFSGTSSVPPTKAFTPNTVPSTQMFSLGVGGTLSSDGFRQEKIHILYKISDLVGPENELPLPKDIQNSQCVSEYANASLFLQSDLKIYEWLRGVANLQRREQAKFQIKNSFTKDGASSDEIKFEIVSSGNITPTWKLVRISANQTAPLFNTSRDRTQDLIITMGPVETTGPSQGQLKPTAQQSAFASELASSIANAVKGTTLSP